MEQTATQLPPLFEQDKLSALDALDRAQLIAFAPYVWEATKLLVDKGILKLVDEAHQSGITLEDIAKQTNMSLYGVRILLEAALGLGLVIRKGDKFILAKTGYMLLNNTMTRINFEFMRDCCSKGAEALGDSIEESKPLGLKTLGNWETIYQGLSILPSPAKESWFAFDHYYSDNAFPEALKIVFDKPIKKILDIGGNTGKWTLQCLQHDDKVQMGILDLKVQLNVAKQNIDEAGFSGRVQYHEHNVLDSSLKIPSGYDVIWMSQFLDCFSDNEIRMILNKCYDVADGNTRIFINETFWDRQRFPTSAFALQMTSLYFTTMANGNSQMYDSKVFYKIVEEAGFDIVAQHDQIGLSHTIIELKKKGM